MSIKIGFLSFYSSIYPDMSGDILNGFFSVMPESIIKENFFQVVPEYVRQAGSKNTTDAIKKLISFDRVDILSGLISYKNIPELIPLVERSNKLAFFLDMGEYIPYNHYLSDRFFFNSFQFWQAEYALGYWAQKTFGDKGCAVMSMFDSGFHLQSAFRQGTISAGGTAIDYTVFSGDPATINIAQRTKEYLLKVEAQPPSFIHPILCGSEAVDFMKIYRNSPLYGKVPLLITPHMASEEILSEIDTDMNVYAASMYNYDAIDKHNIAFKSIYENKVGKKPTIFSLMGYELGLAMLELVPLLRKRDFAEVSRVLKNQTIMSPRGERSFYLDSSYALPVIDIEKISVQNRQVKKIVVEQGRALKYNHAVYDEIHRENVSGWQNPYLCV